MQQRVASRESNSRPLQEDGASVMGRLFKPLGYIQKRLVVDLSFFGLLLPGPNLLGSQVGKDQM